MKHCVCSSVLSERAAGGSVSVLLPHIQHISEMSAKVMQQSSIKLINPAAFLGVKANSMVEMGEGLTMRTEMCLEMRQEKATFILWT